MSGALNFISALLNHMALTLWELILDQKIGQEVIGFCYIRHTHFIGYLNSDKLNNKNVVSSQR